MPQHAAWAYLEFTPHLVPETLMFVLVEWLLLALGAYLAAGAVFGMAFVVRGAAGIDPAANGMPLPARLLLLPGCAALWPLLLVKWRRRQPPPET